MSGEHPAVTIESIGSLQVLDGDDKTAKKYNRDPLSPGEHRFWQNTRLQRQYALGMPVLIVLWLLAVLFVLVWSKEVILVNGEEVLWEIPETVQAILAGSTTVNVIGLLLIVVKYLFDKEGFDQSSN